MLFPRVIPCLLVKNGVLVKSIRFGKLTYIGDPINAIRIFNEKEIDELILLDIGATADNKEPDFSLIGRIASECFMPVCYGGGIRSIKEIERIFGLGIEKVSICSYAAEDRSFVDRATNIFGSQSIVVCIDVKKSWLGSYNVVTHRGKRKTRLDPVKYALELESMGAGEIIINSVDRDGTMSGYDLRLVQRISDNVNIPVVACGGAGRLSDIRDVVKLGRASSGAAGSLFVFFGKHRAVLINYPERDVIEALFIPA